MTTQTETTQRNHHRAVRFFWGFLIGATIVSLTGNVVHAMLPYIPPVAVQIGAAAVPPIALLAAVHGIALAVRAGASGRVYCWAVSAVAVIGLGAFTVSFLALSGLMQAIGYSSTTAWIFPAIIDTAVAVSTLMLVALGDKPARRTRLVTMSPNTQATTMRRLSQSPTQSAKSHVTRFAPVSGRAQTAQAEGAQTSVSVRRDPAQTVQNSAQTEATQDADLSVHTPSPSEEKLGETEGSYIGTDISGKAPDLFAAPGPNGETPRCDCGNRLVTPVAIWTRKCTPCRDEESAA
jgi:Protein of unknown function (DUF2637)